MRIAYVPAAKDNGGKEVGMDHQAAQDCLNKKMEFLKGTFYVDLAKRIGRPQSEFVIGEDGKRYQIETRCFGMVPKTEICE